MPCRAAEQLELALEDLLVAVAEEDDAPIDEGHDEPAIDEPSAPALRRRPRVSDATPRERRELDPGACCPACGGDLRVVGEDVSELLDMIADGINRYGPDENSPNFIRRLEDATGLSVLAPGFPAEMIDDEPEEPGHEVVP